MREWDIWGATSVYLMQYRAHTKDAEDCIRAAQRADSQSSAVLGLNEALKHTRKAVKSLEMARHCVETRKE